MKRPVISSFGTLLLLGCAGGGASSQDADVAGNAGVTEVGGSSSLLEATGGRSSAIDSQALGGTSATQWRSTSGAGNASGGTRASGLILSTVVTGPVGGTTSVFGALDGTSVYDPDNPCSKAIPWITGINIALSRGDTVQYETKVYIYVCAEPLSYTADAYSPTTTVEPFAACWEVTSTTCPALL